MRFIAFVFLVGSSLPLACSSGPPEVPVNPYGKSLAVDYMAVGWEPAGPVWKYEGGALYDYFGMGCEVYRECGCQRVKIQDFANLEGDRVRVEVFEMNSPEGAHALFSLKIRPGGEIVHVGRQGWIEQHVLNFWHGSTQVTLTARLVKEVQVRRMSHLAISVDQGLTGEGDPPAVLKWLPEKGLFPMGRKCLAGPATLKLALGGDAWNFPPPVRGILGNYTGIQGGYQLVILEYENEEAVGAARKSAAPGGPVLNRQRTRMLVVHPKSKGNYLLAYIGPREVEQARSVLDFAFKKQARNRP